MMMCSLCFIIIAVFVLQSDGYYSILHKLSPCNRNFILAAAEVEVLNSGNNQKITINPGAPLSLAAARTGLRLSFQCKQGTCSSCETFLDGKRVRTCITKVPDKKSIIICKAPPL